MLVRHTAAAPPLTPLYDGPYLVTARAPTHFTLQVGNRTEIVTIDRLKPAFLPTGTPPAEPPRRGRPPILRTPASPRPSKPRVVTFAPPPLQQRWSNRRSRPPDRFQVAASHPPASRLGGGAMWRPSKYGYECRLCIFYSVDTSRIVYSINVFILSIYRCVIREYTQYYCICQLVISIPILTS